MFKRLPLLWILILLISSINTVHAQNLDKVNISIGNGFELARKTEEIGRVRLSSGSFLHVSQSKKKNLNSLTIELFDEHSQLVRSNVIALNDYPAFVGSQGIISFGDQYYWVCASNEKLRMLYEVSLRPLDVKNCSFAGDKIILCKGIHLSELHGDRMSRKPDYSLLPVALQFAKSPDQSKLLMWGQCYDDAIPDQRYFVSVFDDKMNLLWEKKVISKTGIDRAIYRPFIIDDMTNVYTVLGTYRFMAMHYKPIPDYFDFIKFEPDGRETVLPIHLTGKVVSDVVVSQRPGGQIFLSGCYSNMERKPAEGFFLYEIKDIQDVKMLPVTGLYRYEQLKVNENNDRGAVKMNMFDVVHSADGKTYLLGEESSGKGVGRGMWDMSNDCSGLRLEKYYDVVVACINADGKLGWVTCVPKKQQGVSNPGGCSVAATLYKDEWYIFYMDNKKNIDKQPGDNLNYHADPSGSFFTVVKISGDGLVTRKHLLTPDEYNGNCQFSSPLFNQDGKLILQGYSGHFNACLKKKRYITVSLN